MEEMNTELDTMDVEGSVPEDPPGGAVVPFLGRSQSNVSASTSCPYIALPLDPLHKLAIAVMVEANPNILPEEVVTDLSSIFPSTAHEMDTGDRRQL